MDARVLVTDNADALKTTADQNGVHHQVCKSHVGCNTDALVEQLQASLANGVNPSLEQIGVSVQQALLDLQRLKELMHLRQPETRSELETLYQRHQDAKASPKGKTASVAYRLCNLLYVYPNRHPVVLFYKIVTPLVR